MSTTRRIAKNVAFLYISHIITSVLSFFLLITVARILGDTILGKYSFAISFCAIFAVFLDLGFDILMERNIAQDKTLASKYLGNIFIIKVLLSIIVFGFIVLIINLIHYPTDTTTTVLIFGVSIVLTAFANMFLVTFRAFQRMEYEALVLIIWRLVSVSLGLAALYLGYGLIEIAYAVLIGSIVYFLFSFFICTRKFAKPEFQVDFGLWKSAAKAALPMGFSYIAASLYVRIDTVMLSVMDGDAVVGWYNAAHNLTFSLQPIFRMVGIAVFPVMASFSISSVDSLRFTYEKLFRYILIIALPISVGVMLISDRIIPLFYGNEFNNSVVALQFLAWDMLFVASGVALNRVIISINRQKLLAVATGICALLNIILNLILIPHFSYIGAAIATIATKVVLFGLSFYFISKHLYRIPLHKLVFKPIIACMVMAAFLYFGSDLNLAVLIVSAIVIYFVSFLLMKGFSKEDRELIARAILRRGGKK